MHALDLIVLGFVSALVMMIFVQKTNIEKSKVKVKVKRKY